MITLEQIGGMVTIVVVAMMIVLIAMLLDLVSGKFKPTAYKTLNLTQCVLMTRQSLLNVIDMLASGVSGYTLKIGTINLNKLTAEEKALATNKGWSIIA